MHLLGAASAAPANARALATAPAPTTPLRTAEVNFME
ncbi:Uncharacterised protein [Mycobacteroides abscessus subsp. abscessus]|nr:Uncharacterised protein [Mycobacteroides abscessus subsp. abscessus]